MRTTDNGGLSFEQAFTITIGDVDEIAPTVTITTPAEGAIFTLDQTVAANYICTDAGGSGINTCTGDVPTGTAIDTSTLGAHTFTVTATDNAGNSTPQTHNYSVVTADQDGPIISDVAATPNPVEINTPLVLTAVVDDAATGGSTIASATYNLDGGAFAPMGSSDGLFDETSEDATVNLGAFAESGVHEFCVVGTDASGNQSEEACTLLAVFDPNGGFVTGGGWIDSPAGALTADPTSTGKANFGFVSKYKKGASTPTGNTNFRFKAGNLDFDSTSYDWLVVAGARAQFKGVGTINDAGSYTFILTAIDGQINGGGGTDKFRIKITGPGGVVYDNKPGAANNEDPSTELGGGSIKIHKK